MQKELNLIDDHPRKPHYKYSTTEEKEIYNKKSDEYYIRRDEIISKLKVMVLREALNRSLRLRFEKGGGDLMYCVYKDSIYKLDRADYSDEEMLLQIMELEDEERRKFERLKYKFSQAEKIEKQGNRESIPE